MSRVATSVFPFPEPSALPAQPSDQPRVYLEDSASSLQKLMVSQFDFVWRSLLRLGLLEPDADDAAQEVFVIVSRKLSRIVLGCERQFLFATALRVASTRRRSLRRRREEPLTALDEHELEPRELGPEYLTELSRGRRILQNILDGMDLEQRAPFILFELEELTVSQIASTLGIPVGTVNSRLRTAREHFQVALRRLHARAAFTESRP